MGNASLIDLLASPQVKRQADEAGVGLGVAEDQIEQSLVARTNRKEVQGETNILLNCET